MDPLGNIPIYIAVLKSIEPHRALWLIFRENCIALLVIFLFAFGGESFLGFLGISHESIYLVGGIVLFMISVRMLFPDKTPLSESFAVHGEPMIFPLAIPLIAGPSILAAVMIYSKQLESMWVLSSSIMIAWLASTPILLCAPLLKRWLGEKGISALDRLMGLLLMLIAVNMLLKGLKLCELCGK